MSKSDFWLFSFLALIAKFCEVYSQALLRKLVYFNTLFDRASASSLTELTTVLHTVYISEAGQDKQVELLEDGQDRYSNQLGDFFFNLLTGFVLYTFQLRSSFCGHIPKTFSIHFNIYFISNMLLIGKIQMNNNSVYIVFVI